MKKTLALSAAFVMFAIGPVLHEIQPPAQAATLGRPLTDNHAAAPLLAAQAGTQTEPSGPAEGYAAGSVGDEQVQPRAEPSQPYLPAPPEDQQAPPGEETIPAPQDEGASGEQYLPAPQGEAPDQPGNPDEYQSDQGDGVEEPVTIHEVLPAAPAHGGS